MPDTNPGLMTLFAEALERTDPADRAAYLDGACAGDAALRRRVEALLAAHDGAGRFLEPDATGVSEPAPAATQEATGTSAPETRPRPEPATREDTPDGTITAVAGAAPAAAPDAFVAGQVIAGRYRLLEILGEGGMGTVYRAEQTEPVKRQVALKLIKIGMDSRAVLARFDAERQALALMDHPHIARVFDGGTTAAGQPFFVMELVRGEPLTEYCDRKRLPVRVRLELFVAVCQAVQHAHQKGIIHRDLKPSNVLISEVDGRPAPKVIDFGVAKATGFQLTDQSLADTGAIVGTPAYMSPEQADPSSMDIDTRTDVYALGVILYELLAGSPPLEAKALKRGAILEMLRMVREVDPPRPSTRVSTAEALPSIAASRAIEPEQLKRALRGDLDWIAMKALEKDRTRRYETANAFAADVLRHLASEPVLAAPPSRAYRLRKFVRKHRGAVIAASLVVLALLAGIAGTTWGLIREANRVTERDGALKQAADRAEERDLALKTANDRADDLKYRRGVSQMVQARIAYGAGQVVTAAGIAYEAGSVVTAAEWLDDVPPGQRGWEWRHMKQQTRGGLFTLYGHIGTVTSVSFSPDGSRIVTCGRDRTAKVWDARTGTALLELRGHMGTVNGASFSPDGARVVTGSDDGTAKVWDARTGTALFDLGGQMSAVTSASFSPDGSRIVTGSRDRTAKVWDARAGAALLELRGHNGYVISASFSPDGSRIVTGSWDRTAMVWDARTGTALLELRGPERTGTALIEPGGFEWFLLSASFSPDGSRILTASTEGAAKVWDARTGSLLLKLKGSQGVGARSALTAGGPSRTLGFGGSFSPDGSRIITGSVDGTAKVWDARTGELLLELRGHTGGVTSASFSPDASLIATGSADGTAKVWDARTGSASLDLIGHEGAVRSASFSPDGSRILTARIPNGNQDRATTAQVWDARTGAALLELPVHKGARSASFGPDGSRILTVSLDGRMEIWDARTGAAALKLKGDTGAVVTASFSPDGTRIVTGSRTATVWDAHSGSLLLELKGSGGPFSPDGSRILIGGSGGPAKVCDARTGAPLLELKGQTGWWYSASFAPDGSRIVIGSDETANVWDARTGAALLKLTGPSRNVTSASFNPDSSRILTCGDDLAATLWDARTGSPLFQLKGGGGVESASFSRDGSRIVTGSRDGTTKVWYAREIPLLLELTGHTSPVWWVSFSPDGSRIVTGSSDGTAKVWDARTGSASLDLIAHNGAVTSASFSPDGSRVVTGSTRGTATVWDARTGTALLELQGHMKLVLSVAFSPDGSRIVTGGDDSTATVWDARTGMALLELKGQHDPKSPESLGTVGSVAFSPDGSRIVTGIGEEWWAWDRGSGIAVDSSYNFYLEFFDTPENTARVRDTQASKVWDARTGQELEGERLLPETPSSPISPDGRSIAHAVGNRVELIALHPDAEELDYRRSLTRPNPGRYRREYDEAKKIGDEFAARFYLGLLSPRSRADAILSPLFASLLIREDVIAALTAQPADDPQVQAACLKMAETWPESAEECNYAGWALVVAPGLPAASYQRGLRLAKAACRLDPENGAFLNTLGVGQYRCGLIAEALATLTRSNALNHEKDPSDLAILALAQHRLGQTEKVLETLARLRAVMKDPQQAGNQEARAFLHEAETIELDRVFPADPFSP